MPLIASSILSKKIAGGAEVVILDVKCGSGAFMKDLDDARELADWLVTIGQLSGLRVSANISDMDQPLGSAVGNALEVSEALSILRNSELTPPVARFRKLCVHYAALALWTSGVVAGEEAGRLKAEEALQNGSALEKATAWFKAQGGDIYAMLPRAPISETLIAQSSGWLANADAETIGQAVVDLGGGRKSKEDEIDHSVGLEVFKMVGDGIEVGEPLATIHAATQYDAERASAFLGQAFQVSSEPVNPRPLFLR